MPYYQWVGIDLLGNTVKGTTCSASAERLEHTLLEQEVALIKIKVANRSFKTKLRKQDICNLFKQLHVLLDSGVFLSQALETLAHVARGHILEQLLTDIHTHVHQGASLSDALSMFPDQFDMLTITMIKAGEEAGNVPAALAQICEVLDARISFNAKMRAATLTPLVTFSFFLIIITFITVFIIPQFKHLFAGQAQLPWLTRCLIMLSDCVVYYGIYSVLMIIGLITCMRASAPWPTSVSTRSRISRDALLVKVTARISHARARPRLNIWAMRVVSTRVLPVPAPARTSTGPSSVSTAARCSGLSTSR